MLKNNYVWIYMASFRNCRFQLNPWLRHLVCSVDVYFMHLSHLYGLLCLLLIDFIYRRFLWIIHLTFLGRDNRGKTAVGRMPGDCCCITCCIRLIIVTSFLRLFGLIFFSWSFWNTWKYSLFSPHPTVPNSLTFD